MEKYLLICKSEIGGYFNFICNKKPTKEQFDKYVKSNIPLEYDQKCDNNYLCIEKCVNINDIKNINF